LGSQLKLRAFRRSVVFRTCFAECRDVLRFVLLFMPRSRRLAIGRFGFFQMAFFAEPMSDGPGYFGLDAF